MLTSVQKGQDDSMTVTQGGMDGRGRALEQRRTSSVQRRSSGVKLQMGREPLTYGTCTGQFILNFGEYFHLVSINFRELDICVSI